MITTAGHSKAVTSYVAVTIVLVHPTGQQRGPAHARHGKVGRHAHSRSRHAAAGRKHAQRRRGRGAPEADVARPITHPQTC